MQWISGRDLYHGMPHWIVEEFFDTIVRDTESLKNNLGLEGSIEEFEFEIFKSSGQRKILIDFGVRMYYDGILLRDYRVWLDCLTRYFEPPEMRQFTRSGKMDTALGFIWQRTTLAR